MFFSSGQDTRDDLIKSNNSRFTEKTDLKTADVFPVNC